MRKCDMLREKVEFGNFRNLVETIGEKYADKPAFSYRINPRDEKAVQKSYSQLRSDVRAFGTTLIARDIAGKHIVVIGKQSYPWIVSYFTILATGSVIVPLDKDWSKEDLAATAERADGEFVLVDPELMEKGTFVAEAIGAPAPIALSLETVEGCEALGELIADGDARLLEGDKAYFEREINPDKLSLLVFTSGTTGKGKGVMLTQTAVMKDLSDVIPYMDFADKSVNVLPPHHTYGSSVTMLGHASIGIESYISSGIRYILKELELEKPGHLILVPLYLETFYRKILANIKQQGKEKLVNTMLGICNFLHLPKFIRRAIFKDIHKAFGGELKMVISGGAALAQDIVDFFNGIGITVLNGYGITECAPIVAVNHSKSIVPGAVGYVLDVNDVKIDEPNEDGEGEILVKGPNVMLGYYKDEAATADAMTEDGYFRTGDYGKLDKNNALFITGRKKNLIILSNGKNVYPEEIEAEFTAVPGVLDIVVYEGKSKRGSSYDAIVAEIYPDQDYIDKNNITDIKAHLQKFVDDYNRTAVPYKKIGVLKVREEEFPKNTLRKIMRFKIDMSID